MLSCGASRPDDAVGNSLCFAASAPYCLSHPRRATTRIRIMKRRELGILAASLAGGEQEKVLAGGEQEKKLPLVNRTSKALSHWLSPAYGAVLELKPGLDQIEALSSERDAL